MARIVNPEENAAKRNQILDATQALLFTKGYDKMTIQDILDRLQMSKGAFYHYFGSKEALLEALTDRMMDQVLTVLHPIEVDTTMTAVEKLRVYLNTASQWKTDRHDILLKLVRGWYRDDNLMARKKYFTKSMGAISGFMTQVICQGVHEGSMTTPYPEQVGELILAMFLNMGEAMAQEILEHELQAAQVDRIEQLVAVYEDALERILGVAPGALPLADTGLLRRWVETAEAEPVPAEPLAV